MSESGPSFWPFLAPLYSCTNSVVRLVDRVHQIMAASGEGKSSGVVSAGGFARIGYLLYRSARSNRGGGGGGE